MYPDEIIKCWKRCVLLLAIHYNNLYLPIFFVLSDIKCMRAIQNIVTAYSRQNCIAGQRGSNCSILTTINIFACSVKTGCGVGMVRYRVIDMFLECHRFTSSPILLSLSKAMSRAQLYTGYCTTYYLFI